MEVRTISLSIFDARTGQRIVEYLYDLATSTTQLVREYIWLNDIILGVLENVQLYAVRTDHIGRPVFATNSAGAVVWSVAYEPFGGVIASSCPSIDLRFPGQWLQSENNLDERAFRAEGADLSLL